jgi:2'-hydroxyisoflavone reductase
VTAAEVSIAWVPTEFLLEQGIQPWSELTVWRRPSTEGVLAVRVERAIAAGLTYRPLADTAKDTLEWWHGLPATRRETPVAGLAPERERAVLAAWHRLRQG